MTLELCLHLCHWSKASFSWSEWYPGCRLHWSAWCQILPWSFSFLESFWYRSECLLWSHISYSSTQIQSFYVKNFNILWKKKGSQPHWGFIIICTNLFSLSITGRMVTTDAATSTKYLYFTRVELEFPELTVCNHEYMCIFMLPDWCWMLFFKLSIHYRIYLILIKLNGHILFFSAFNKTFCNQSCG